MADAVGEYSLENQQAALKRLEEANQWVASYQLQAQRAEARATKAQHERDAFQAEAGHTARRNFELAGEVERLEDENTALKSRVADLERQLQESARSHEKSNDSGVQQRRRPLVRPASAATIGAQKRPQAPSTRWR
jgi:cell division septum initiation protein DivIVA